MPSNALNQSDNNESKAPEKVTIPVTGFSALSAELHRSSTVKAPALLWLPAMGVPAKYYRRFGAAIAARGITTLVLDLRGQGDSVPRVGRQSHFGYRHLVETDCSAAVRTLRQMTGNVPIILGGYSLGGHIAVLHAISAAQKPDGVVLIAAQNPHFHGYSGLGSLRMLLAPQLIAAITNLWGYWPGDRLGFGGRQPKELINDWARVCRTGQWTHDGQPDYRVTMPSVSFPVFAASIKGDPDAPSSAVDRLCSQLSACEIRHWEYHPVSLDSSGHLRWARGAAEPIAQEVADWMAQIGLTNACYRTH